MASSPRLVGDDPASASTPRTFVVTALAIARSTHRHLALTTVRTVGLGAWLRVVAIATSILVAMEAHKAL